jgi:polyferredoxin
MAVRLPARLRVLRTLGHDSHRFVTIRRFTMTLTLVVLYAVPLGGFARFDLWDGRHLAAGKPVNFVWGGGALLLSIVGLYLITFLINAVAGRLFCGFGCPVGEVSRLADAAEIAAVSRDSRLPAAARRIGFELALAGAAFLWLASPRVFVEGSPRAVAIALAGVAAGTGVLHAMGRFLRWKFCRFYCPIGVYYSAVQTAHRFNIHFDEVHATCKGCDVCAEACPVGLTPRDLSRPVNGLEGIGIDGFPQANHCLMCGDCVRACEHVVGRAPGAVVPLSLSRRPDRRKPPSEHGGSTSKRQARP